MKRGLNIISSIIMFGLVAGTFYAKTKTYPVKGKIISYGISADGEKMIAVHIDPKSNVYKAQLNRYDFESFDIIPGSNPDTTLNEMKLHFAPVGSSYSLIYIQYIRTNYMEKEYILGQQHFLNIKGREFGPYQKVWLPAYSENGKKYAFTSVTKNKYHVRINKKVFGPFDWASLPVLSGTNKLSFAFSYSKAGSDFVRYNENKYGPFTIAEPPILSKNGKGIGFVFQKDKKYALFINGKTNSGYSSAHYPVFSANGDHYAYIFRHGTGKTQVMIDEKSLGEHDSVSNLAISDDGSQYTFTYIKDNKSFIKTKGTEFGPFTTVLYPGFIPGTTNLYYFYTTKTEFPIKYSFHISGKDFGPYEEVSAPRFYLKDNKQRSVFLCRQNYQYYLFNDGLLSGPYPKFQYAIDHNGIISICYAKNGNIVIEKFEE